jgi:tRNA-dihydrouridine synthase
MFKIEFICLFTKMHQLPKIGNIQLPDFPLLLAPMEDVSDPPFRRLCKLHGADMMYSEFISSEGLIRDAIKSQQKLNRIMAMSAEILEAVNPDLIDINFVCSVQ